MKPYVKCFNDYLDIETYAKGSGLQFKLVAYAPYDKGPAYIHYWAIFYEEGATLPSKRIIVDMLYLEGMLDSCFDEDTDELVTAEILI